MRFQGTRFVHLGQVCMLQASVCKSSTASLLGAAPSRAASRHSSVKQSKELLGAAWKRPVRAL